MALIDEILEQPAVVDRLIGRLPSLTAPVVAEVRRRGIEHVMIAGRGSSDHAAVYAVYAIGAVGRLPVALAAPSLFSRYGTPPSVTRTLVVGISQSGRSPDVVAVLDEARRQGAVTLAVTNDVASPLADAAQHLVDLGAGPERSVAATKTYTAGLAAMAGLAAALADAPAGAWSALRRVPDRLAAALDARERAEAAAGEARPMTGCVVLGRGFHLATALEWALKLKELAGVRAQAYSTADFEHGPVASFGDGDWLLAIRAAGPLSDDLDRLAARLATERAARVMTVAIEPPPHGDWLPLADDVPDWLSPVVAIVPIQLFTAALTVEKGMDPEQPRELRKVTLTR